MNDDPSSGLSPAASSLEEYVQLICPACKARLHPRAEHAGRKVRCPDCYSTLTVPAAVAPPPPVVPPARPAVGEYSLKGDASGRLSDYFLVLCPTCRARMHPSFDQVGKKVRCPDCDTVIRVPEPPPPEPVSPPNEHPGEYDVGASVESRPAPETSFLLVQDRAVEPERPEPMPKHWYAAGVFTFPWRRDAVARWLGVSAGLTIAVWLFVFILQAAMAGGYVMIAAVALMPALAFTLLASLAYLANCFTGIVPDTCASSREIHNWPDADWAEWLWPFLLVLYVTVLACAVSYGAAYPLLAFASLSWVAAIVFDVCLVCAFSFLFLSSLEAESPFLPFSLRIARSLSLAWPAWLLICGESLLAFAACEAILWLLHLWSDALAIMAIGPLFAAATFIYARLLGRLAWRIGKAETERRKRDTSPQR